MAQQDKTDFYWNGVLSGAVNNLYYDLINVDVCHVPYATNHRNSSFFLKTRLAYSISEKWLQGGETAGFEITDIKIIWDEECDNVSGNVYALGRKDKVKAIFATDLDANGCVRPFYRCTKDDIIQTEECGDWKLFTTEYVKGTRRKKEETIAETTGMFELVPGSKATEVTGENTGIQINQYQLGTTIGLFSDENIKNGYAKFSTSSGGISPGNYLLVYNSSNLDGSGFAGQVRMITGVDNQGRLILDSPWLGFKVIDTSGFAEKEKKEQEGNGVGYAIFNDWGEVLGFTNNKNVEIMYQPHDCAHMSIYNQNNRGASSKGKIIGVASTTNKIFVLTKNGYVHYNKDTGGYNKFFINDDMFAGPDKIAIASYRDMILAFGRKHIAIGVPDEQNNYWTMYNQAQSIGLWSRYSFTEYDGDLIFVSNDKRLLALTVQSAGRYGLSFEDIGDRLNGKLSVLRPGDKVYLGADNNNLRVFCNTSERPYKEEGGRADIRNFIPTSTHIYKFDTLFKVWTEDYIAGHLITGAAEGIYYGGDGIYVRNDAEIDCGDTEYKTNINAYLIENESNGLDNHPLLFQLAKLNRLITTLGPGIYSDTTKIKITNYTKGIGYTYEFPINGDGNLWVGLMTSYYLNEELDEEQTEKLNCILSTLQDGQIKYQPNCTDSEVYRQFIAQNAPWCEDYDELLTESHGVCINDKLYELAPTMPLVTSLGENQTYSTQIKIELIGGKGDIITFGGWLAELYLAPLGLTGPDGEYQLQPQTDC